MKISVVMTLTMTTKVRIGANHQKRDICRARLHVVARGECGLVGGKKENGYASQVAQRAPGDRRQLGCEGAAAL